ncbi:MAG: hypothetical protein HUJ24_08395 [Rhodobacteraceae bacterium]|nr:hypothetical protein [Paracoccaceae bacterium]
MGSLTFVVQQCRFRVINLPVVALCGIVASCGLKAPDTGYDPSQAARRADFPALLTQSQVDAATQTTVAAADTTPIADRADALRARAAALSGPVIDPTALRRLQTQPNPD